MGEGWNNQLVQVIILSLPGGFSGLFGYSPSPGPGNLVISITNQAGTDPFGNPYPPGVCVGPSSGPQVNITGGNPAVVSFPLNDPSFNVDPSIYGQIITGPPKYAAMQLDGPQVPVASHHDLVEIQLNSPNSDGSSSANMSLSYHDSNGNSKGYVIVDRSGAFIPACNFLAAVLPGTGTSSTNPAQNEGWHAMTLDAGWSTVVNYRAPSYRLTPDGMIQLAGNASQSFPSSAGINLNGSNPLPVAYRSPATTVQDFRSSDVVGNRCHVTYSSTGIVRAIPLSTLTFPATCFCEIDAVLRIV
jgi:hypothetical protein